jgi:hypothetical protein
MAVTGSSLETLRGILVSETSEAIYVEEKDGSIVHRVQKGRDMHELSRREEGRFIVVTFVTPLLNVQMLGMGRLVV